MSHIHPLGMDSVHPSLWGGGWLGEGEGGYVYHIVKIALGFVLYKLHFTQDSINQIYSKCFQNISHIVCFYRILYLFIEFFFFQNMKKTQICNCFFKNMKKHKYLSILK